MGQRQQITLAFLTWLVCGGLLAGLSQTPSPSQPNAVTLKNAYRVVGPYAKDGDTIGCQSVELPFTVSLRNVTIRASNYDACETTRQRYSNTTDAEIKRGKQAEDWLKTTIAKGDFFLVPPTKVRDHDAFGRLLGEFYVYDQAEGRIIDVYLEMKHNGWLRP